MWLKVEADAADDWRVQDLADELGISHGDAFEALFRVWGQLYKRGGGPMSPREVDGAARRRGVAEALIKCQLAEASLEGLRVKGDRRVEELQHYRNKQSNNAKKRKPVDNSSAKTQPNTSQSAAMAEPVTLLYSSLLSSSLSSPDLPEKNLDTSTTREPLALQVQEPTARAEKKPPSDVKQAIDHFHARYVERTGGASPTWGGPQTALLKQLIARHGVSRVIAHIDVLFDSPPRFLSEQLPDVRTLAAHFDKLTPTVASSRQVTPEQMAKMALDERARRLKAD